MNLVPVESSNIEAIGHDGDRMRVRYLDGRIYDFLPTTADEYAAIMLASSKGKALAAFVADKGIKGQRISDAPQTETAAAATLDAFPDEGCCGTARRCVDLSKRTEWRCPRCHTLWKVIGEGLVRHWEAFPEFEVW